MRLSPGEQIGPYEITVTLGAGGNGEVYRARDTPLERTVAIKILLQLSSDPSSRQRFEREAKAISCLTPLRQMEMTDHHMVAAGR